ncbi:MAG: hypothetical protein U5R06_23005 [candidate division KSB1 bacterium]|nr:hypothetical protein [candidate division KSB1 bacterium]
MKKVILLLGSILFIMSCDIDPGLEPTHSGFTGTVYFSHEPPSGTDKVMVVAVRNFPPSGVTDLITGPSLSLSSDSATYEFYTPEGTYEAVGVVWKEQGQAWSISNIIGIYFPTSDYFTPGQVHIGSSTTVVESIDINADFSRAAPASNSGIRGTLNVKGEWPPSALSVPLAASQGGLPTSLLDIEFGLPIQAGFKSASYSLSLPPGTYNLVGALLVKKDKPVGLESLAGYYKNIPTSVLPSAVTIETDTSWVEPVDINLFFN